MAEPKESVGSSYGENVMAGVMGGLIVMIIQMLIWGFLFGRNPFGEPIPVIDQPQDQRSSEGKSKAMQPAPKHSIEDSAKD